MINDEFVSTRRRAISDETNFFEFSIQSLFRKSALRRIAISPVISMWVTKLNDE